MLCCILLVKWEQFLCVLLKLSPVTLGMFLSLQAGRVDGVIALLQVLAHMELSPSLLAASQVGTVISKLRKHADTRVASKARCVGLRCMRACT